MAAILAGSILPRHLFHSPEVIHSTIDVLAGFIGPVYGVIIVDYYRVKARHIEVHDLYNDREGGRYWYTRGWNLKAVAALIAGGVLSMLFQLSPTFANFSFFIGAIGSGLAYYAPSPGLGRAKPFSGVRFDTVGSCNRLPMTTSLPRVFPNSLSADGQKSANFAHHLKAPLGRFRSLHEIPQKKHTP